MINGLLHEKWRMVQEIGEKINKYTLWIRYKVINIMSLISMQITRAVCPKSS